MEKEVEFLQDKLQEEKKAVIEKEECKDKLFARFKDVF